jgi:glycosyltransferase involved in cell wall biosynthesis
MATYNGARFIGEQLKSFVDQTCPPHELVVCDDGSSDETADMVEKFAGSVSFCVTLHRNSSQYGVLRNFEKAVHLCNGELIFLSDQDDVWLASKLEAVADIFRNNTAVAVVTNDQVIADAALVSSSRTKLNNVRAAGLPPTAMITGCCTAFRGEWKEVALPIPEIAPSHDGWICGLADLIGARLILDEPLQLYRRHESNASHWEMSNVAGPRRLWAFRRYGLSDARSGWHRQVELANAMAERLAASEHLLTKLGLADRLPGALAYVERKCAALEARTKMISYSRLRRLPHWCKFAIGGHYREFDGWKSAVKDLVRPS